jgi:DNA-binding MarR family transcriptional regulator
MAETRRDDPTPYAGSLAFLLSQVGAYSARRFAEQLAPLGVSPRAFGVLSNLVRDGSQTQQQLADALAIHRNRMVGLIDEVEAAGLARRHRSASDRRAFEVRLTPAGSALVKRVNALIPVLDRELGKGLSAGERDALTALLRRTADALELSAGVHPHLQSPPVQGEAGRRPTGDTSAAAGRTTHEVDSRRRS